MKDIAKKLDELNDLITQAETILQSVIWFDVVYMQLSFSARDNNKNRRIMFHGKTVKPLIECDVDTRLSYFKLLSPLVGKAQIEAHRLLDKELADGTERITKILAGYEIKLKKTREKADE